MNKEDMKKLLNLSSDKYGDGKDLRPGIRILLIDCSDAEIGSIRYEIEKGREFKVVGIAKDVHKAREMVKSLKPDLVIMDIMDPRSGGIGFLKRLQHFHPIPVMLISPVSRMPFRMVVSAFKLGATRIIDKESLDIFRKNGSPSKGLSFFEHIKLAASA
ncbi:MAG: response regulator [bacterium]